MDSLLTLSLGDYRAVELALRLVVTLVALSALLLGFTTCCVPLRFRFPMIFSSVALLGAAWFEAGIWISWKEAFELAGSSYCVTGQLLAGEDRIIAWAIAVPALIFSFGLIQIPGGRTFTHPLARLGAAALALGVFSPLSSLLSFVLLGVTIWILCWKIPAAATDRPLPLLFESRLAAGSISLAFFISLLGSWHLLPLGKSAESILVRGELFRSLCEILSLVVPAIMLLAGILRYREDQSTPTPEPLPVREKKPKLRESTATDTQSGLFGN